MYCKICDKSFTGLVCFQQHEASEKHKKKVNLYQGATASVASQETSTSNELLLIPCTVCEIQLRGMIHFQTHVNSLQHADAVRKKSEGNDLPNDQSGYAPNKPEITGVNNCTNPSSNIPFNLTNGVLGSYAECKVCQKQFSGPAPYQQHIVSEPHKKKCIQRGLSIVPENQLKSTSNEPAIAEPKNETNPCLNVPLYVPNTVLGSYAHCEACQKQFSGPAPYEQHLVSEAHKKKCIQKGLSPENQLKSASKELITAETKNEIYSIPNISSNIPNGTLGSFAQCKVCQKEFSGPAPYEQHLASEIHKKKVIQKELSSSKLSFDTVDSDKIMPFVNHQNNVSNNSTSGTAHPFAECKSCNMQFTGCEPYQLHLDSAGHQKKIAVERSSSIQAPENTNGVASSWKCDICDKDFTGPIPLNDHLVSIKHKNKVQNIGCLKAINCSKPDFPTPDPNYITQDVKINTGSSGINREWYCEVCKKQTTGPEPYRQHIYGELHRKNKSKNEFSKDDQFKSNLLNFNNGDKTNEFSKDFRISNDLILCDTLKNIGVVRPEDLNITIFYPDDELVFDTSMKKNNYNDNIISELSFE